MSRALLAEFADVVLQGLADRPKRMPPAWLLDDEGLGLRARVAEQPECYPQAAERAALAEHAAAMLQDSKASVTLVDIGADAPDRTRIVVEALLRRQGRAQLVPLDVRGDTLRAYAQGFQGVPGLRVRPVQGHARASLRALPQDAPRIVLVLGERIGQLGPDEGARFLADVRAALTPADAVLLTTDLPKPGEDARRARDDAAGWSAKLHANLLARMNRELGAAFDPAGFAYRATWEEAQQAVRMDLVSAREQEVRIRAVRRTYHFAEGEALHTEDAYLFTSERLTALAHAAGLRVERSWSDAQGRIGVHRLGIRPAPPAA